MNGKRFCGLLLSACLGAAAYGQLRDRPSAAESGTFRVTSWPDHKSADQDYAEEVETHLNKMAKEGWRYHSEAVGQFGKMMIFERSTGK